MSKLWKNGQFINGVPQTDRAISYTSENPLQNKVISKELLDRGICRHEYDYTVDATSTFDVNTSSELSDGYTPIGFHLQNATRLVATIGYSQHIYIQNLSSSSATGKIVVYFVKTSKIQDI